MVILKWQKVMLALWYMTHCVPADREHVHIATDADPNVPGLLGTLTTPTLTRRYQKHNMERHFRWSLLHKLLPSILAPLRPEYQ